MAAAAAARAAVSAASELAAAAAAARAAASITGSEICSAPCDPAASSMATSSPVANACDARTAGMRLGLSSSSQLATYRTAAEGAHLDGCAFLERDALDDDGRVSRHEAVLLVDITRLLAQATPSRRMSTRWPRWEPEHAGRTCAFDSCRMKMSFPLTMLLSATIFARSSASGM